MKPQVPNTISDKQMASLQRRAQVADKHKAFRVGGDGKSRAITPATTPEKAREAAQAARQRVKLGSSTSFEVREPKHR